MNYTVKQGKVATSIPQIVEEADDGDTIVVANQSQRELVERAISRMKPQLKVNIVIKEQPS